MPAVYTGGKYYSLFSILSVINKTATKSPVFFEGFIKTMM